MDKGEGRKRKERGGGDQMSTLSFPWGHFLMEDGLKPDRKSNRRLEPEGNREIIYSVPFSLTF